MIANQKDALLDPSEIVAGEALLHHVPNLQGDALGMFAAVRKSHAATAEVLPQVREHALPVIAGAPSFRGCYTFRDERDVIRGVSVSIHQTCEHAMEANQQVMSVMRERRIAPKPPSVMAEPAVIAATNVGA